MSEKNGGPAFPAYMFTAEVSDRDYLGMSLRDYFAGQALAGGMHEFLTSGDAWSDYEDFARSCYRVADAMLKERAK